MRWPTDVGDLLDRASWGAAYTGGAPKGRPMLLAEAVIARSRDPKYLPLRRPDRVRLAEAEIEMEWLCDGR